MAKVRSEVVVSAAIPCYNGERFIAQIIKSLLNQTRPPDEILVIDDGSTDRSAEIVKGFGDKVRLIRHGVNRGLAQARNTAVEQARGDILVFVDVDAYADPEYIASLLAHYTCKEVAGVGGQNIESNIQSVYDVWRKKHLSQSAGDAMRENCEALSGSCSSFRREALQAVGGFNPFFRTNGEDWDIALRLRQVGYKLTYTPEAKVYHQRTDTWKSLHRLVYRYVYWAYLPMAIDGAKPSIGHFVHFICGNFKNWLLSDLLEERSLKMAILDMTAFVVRLAGLVMAVLFMTTIGARLKPIGAET